MKRESSAEAEPPAAEACRMRVSDMAGQLQSTGLFHARHVRSVDMGVAAIVEGMADGGGDQDHEGHDRQRPHMPDQGEAKDRAQHGQREAGGGVLRHVDVDETAFGPAVARLLHAPPGIADRKSTRLNSSHVKISYAVFCLKK